MGSTDDADSASPGWLAARLGSLRWISLGVVSFGVAVAAVWTLAPRLDPMPEASDRLLLAVQLAALPAGVLFLILQSLWRIAEPNPGAEDPLAGVESRRFQVNQRVFSNTVEQTLIFVPMMLALAIRIAPEDTWLLPALVGLWCAGRLLFWGGYHVHVRARAIGMDWTTGVAVATAGWLVYTLF